MPDRPLKILVVDDHPLMRDGLRLLLKKAPWLEWVGEASNAIQALALARELQPDIAIVDFGLPDLRGSQLARALQAGQPGLRILILTGQSDPALLEEALAAGVNGYVLKENSTDNLLDALGAIAQGRIYVSPALAEGALERYQRLVRHRQGPRPESLSEREAEVVHLIAEGCNTKEIAARLSLSVKTIETHRQRIMDKLQLHSVAEITKYAIRNGLSSV